LVRRTGGRCEQMCGDAWVFRPKGTVRWCMDQFKTSRSITKEKEKKNWRKEGGKNIDRIGRKPSPAGTPCWNKKNRERDLEYVDRYCPSLERGTEKSWERKKGLKARLILRTVAIDSGTGSEKQGQKGNCSGDSCNQDAPCFHLAKRGEKGRTKKR